MRIREQFFISFIKNGIKRLVNEMQNNYQIKKGDRFSVKGITYEIGIPKLSNNFVEFEISSKIPQDELENKSELTKYFNEVKKAIGHSDEHPASIEMENIIRSINSDEEKKRDYVKLTYKYNIDKLYSEKEVLARVEDIKKDPSKQNDIPQIGGVTTLVGKLILLSIEEEIYSLAKQSVNNLIEANQKVRKEMKYLQRAS